MHLNLLTVFDVLTTLFNMSGGLFIVAALLFVGLMKIAYRERRHFPPGPTGIPLLGSAHQLPERFQEQKLSEWGKQYGSRFVPRLCIHLLI